MKRPITNANHITCHQMAQNNVNRAIEFKILGKPRIINIAKDRRKGGRRWGRREGKLCSGKSETVWCEKTRAHPVHCCPVNRRWAVAGNGRICTKFGCRRPSAISTMRCKRDIIPPMIFKLIEVILSVQPPWPCGIIITLI
eukprot:14388528-Ditylum_brightwellii.AAC.1